MPELFPFWTARLLLRPVRDADLARLFEILADGDVMKLALYERPLTAVEAQQFIAEDFSKDVHDIVHLGVLCRAVDEAVIGFAGLLPCRYFPGELELGFVLAADHQGKGYGTEIGTKLVDIAFRTLHCQRLLALCDPRNEPSKNALQKLGMKATGEEIATPDRGPRMVFSITRSDVVPAVADTG